MINLIKNEFKKILHKKSFYIVTLIFILYTIFTNIIYKNITEYEIKEDNLTVQDYIELNEKLDLNDLDDLSNYVENLTNIEILNLHEKYPSNNQIYLIDKYLYDLIYDFYEEKYINKNERNLKLITEKIEFYKLKIADENWLHFANLKLTDLKSINLEGKDDLTKKRYEELIGLAIYRIKNSIPYDKDNYINNAIITLETDMFEYYNLMNNKNLTKIEANRLDYLKERYLKNKYILEHKKDVNNEETLQAVLSNFSAEFGLFILIYVVMVNGSIVSEEFNKGTIKYLLTKPYKRSKILTSKLITTLLLLPINILLMIVIELIIGGIILDFHSLNIPILIYNNLSNTLTEYNIFKYLGMLLLSNMPMYGILSILCFALSTITLSTSAAITITFLFYLVSNVISNLALIYDLVVFKYFISLHWDFSYLINFKVNPYNNNIYESMTVILIYICLIICITYVDFNKKDVKNV